MNFTNAALKIKSDATVFHESNVKPEEKDAALAKALATGYSLEGKHRSEEIYLLKKADEYVMLRVTDTPLAHPAIGIAVTDVDSNILKISKHPEVDVFDGGKVGHLSLHLPAYRDKKGQFIYLIDNKLVSHFFAIDFVKLPDKAK